MILLNCLFITSLLIDSKLDSKKDDKNTVNKLFYFPENQTYSREISNVIIWKTLLTNLNKEHFITIDDLVNEYTFLSRNDIINSCKEKITVDNNIYFYDFNKFMLSIVDNDYQKLLSLIKTDFLKTPSDWSTISTDASSITSLELNEDIINIDNIDSNKDTKVKFFNPKNINIEIKNIPKHINKYPTTINPLLNPISLNIKELERPKEVSLPKEIELSIEDEKYNNPNLKSRNKTTKQANNYTKTNPENKKKYSWYLEYFIYCYKYIEDYITNRTFCKNIDVPIWVKKYF